MGFAGLAQTISRAVYPFAVEAEFVRGADTVECRAIVGSFSAFAYSSGQIGSEERRVLVLGDGLEIEPRPGDVIRINARDWFVVTADLDPAGAVWRLRVR